MSMDLETGIKAALQDIDAFKTPTCLDATILGRYVEGRLDDRERQAVETHLHTCIYCLKHLNDTTELLHAARTPQKLSPKLERAIQQLLPKDTTRQQADSSLWGTVASFFDFTLSQWRFAALGLATALLVFIVSSPIIRQQTGQAKQPGIATDAFAKVQLMSDAGNILREEQGVVIDRSGLVATSLKPMVGGSRVQITLRDGTTYQTGSIWKDEDRNLAVMKIDGKDLKAIPTADIKEVTAGKRIFIAADPAHNRYQDGIVSDFRETPSRRNMAGAKYMQVATMTTTATRGAVLDEKGKLLGFIITEEQNINLATPAGDIPELTKTAKQIPLKDLKEVNFSGKALNEYLQGILARDGQRWDEAISHLKEAVRLNPKLEGAYIELGYAYFRKQDFKNEEATYRTVLNSINPNNADALYSLAWNMESQGRYPEALPLYEKALKYAPEDTEIMYQLGLSYLANKQKDKALSIAERLKRLDPGQAEFLRRLIRR